MYEGWTKESLKRQLDLLDSFGYKMEKEFFEEKELIEENKSNLKENDYMDIKVDTDKPIKAYQTDYLGVEEGQIKGGLGGMILTGVVILIATVLFLTNVVGLNTFLEITCITGLGFIIALIFLLTGIFQHRFLKNLFKDCHFANFKVSDFKKEGLSKYKTITLSFKDYRGCEQVREIKRPIAHEYAKHGKYYYNLPNMRKEALIAYNYQGKFAIVYDYTIKTPDKFEK